MPFIRMLPSAPNAAHSRNSMPMSTLLWAKKLYTFSQSAGQQSSNEQFIRGLKSFCFKGGESNEQMMTE